jgi:hypothetical protein
MRATLVVTAAGSSLAPSTDGDAAGNAPAAQPDVAAASPPALAATAPAPQRAEIDLSGSASGRARFESKDGAVRFRLDLNDAPAGALNVYLSDALIGSMTTRDGDARLELSSGFPDGVSGRTLDVRTASGASVASGRFP